MTDKPDDDDGKVGYGKPPKHSRFKPGQSGNPKGRRRGTNNFRTDVRSALRTPVTVTRNGRPRKISTQAAVVLTLRAAALKGDRHARETLLRLASVHNDDTGAVTEVLSADDAAILEIYKAGVLSGAAEASKPDDADREAADDSYNDEEKDDTGA
jgi:hypothetical protein